MKFRVWDIGVCDPEALERLRQAGYSPLTARVLSSRGYRTPEEARAYLSGAEVLPDPFLMKQMDVAAARVRRAIEEKEHVAVYGDYDVDGITSTCLLTDFLRSMGVHCTPYIPGRVGEGYGLNETAIRGLAKLGVRLIISVDCGITAIAEARLCRELGIDLIITDHHECKSELPQALAVVDPCRRDRTYPHADLCGVGVAFKLVSAVWGSQEQMLRRYADLLCLGTVADVMPLRGENRTFVIRGLQAMQHPARLGLAALIRECCDRQPVTANTVGYVLAPRINAAGRMGRVELALELLLTDDPQAAARAASALCELNRERQRVELEIYRQALGQIPKNAAPKALVLANEHWHQGVVGIVASRLAEECGCPTFLICLDGDHGKASSRSYGGFNLFAALSELSDLLENYGGHELAAGFTIPRGNIDAFRREITARAADFTASSQCTSALRCDCAVTLDLLTLENVMGLEQLEPCGNGCPKPVLCAENLLVEQLSTVGSGGKHVRMRLRAPNGIAIAGIFFSVKLANLGVSVGDRVDVAFTPQVNEYRGFHSVQLNLTDIRLAAQARREAADAERIYQKLRRMDALSQEEAEMLLPVRQEFAAVWRYLVAQSEQGRLADDPERLGRKLTRCGSRPMSLLRVRICLDVFAEQGLIALEEQPARVLITIRNPREKVDLTQSAILRNLVEQKAGNYHGNLSGAL